MLTAFARCFVGATLALFVLASSLAAQVLLPPGHVWEYTFTDPTGDPQWNTTTGVGGNWSLAPAPFGSDSEGDANFHFATYWPPDANDGDDLWLRTTLDLTGIDLGTVGWYLGVDNGFKLYANGNLVGSGFDEGYTHRWEYSGNFGGTLNVGQNVLAVALQDAGFTTAFDMEVSTVPEPASLFLLGMALSIFWSSRLRRRRSPI